MGDLKIMTKSGDDVKVEDVTEEEYQRMTQARKNDSKYEELIDPNNPPKIFYPSAEIIHSMVQNGMDPKDAKAMVERHINEIVLGVMNAMIARKEGNLQ